MNTKCLNRSAQLQKMVGSIELQIKEILHYLSSKSYKHVDRTSQADLRVCCSYIANRFSHDIVPIPW